MQRRTFMIGVGGAVTTGAAALGSGAFTTVDADRSAAVSVVDDSNGLVGLTANTTSEFISETNGTFEISLDGSGSETATGVNAEARTALENALTVTNQAGQSIDVTISLATDDDSIIELSGWTEGGGTWVSDTSNDSITEGDDLIGQQFTLLADGDAATDIDFVVLNSATSGQSVTTLKISASGTN